jgi:hypothetical protein
VRAAGEGTSSPFYVRTHPRLCAQSTIFQLAWRWSGAEGELEALTRPPSTLLASQPFAHQF